MLDPETLKFVNTARDRRQVELSVRLKDSTIRPVGKRTDRDTAAARAQAWNDAEAAVTQAVDEYAHEGLPF